MFKITFSSAEGGISWKGELRSLQGPKVRVPPGRWPGSLAAGLQLPAGLRVPRFTSGRLSGLGPSWFAGPAVRTMTCPPQQDACNRRLHISGARHTMCSSFTPSPKWTLLLGLLSWAALLHAVTWRHESLSLIAPHCHITIFKMGCQGVVEGKEKEGLCETFLCAKSHMVTRRLGNVRSSLCALEESGQMWWGVFDAVLWSP